jgi:phosphoglycolate phosphatase-like HAD superfamily hydrolase
MRKDNNLVTPAPALVLFDIDGTLIRRAGPHHRQVLVDAVRHVTGLETTTDNIPVHGMLDPDILFQMMTGAHATRARIRSAMPAIMEKAQALYVRRCPELSGKVCPGARILLDRLSGRGIPLALVTGNLTRIGWRKMQRCGFGGYFHYGAFAEMARTRADLARLAIRHARRQGWIGKDAIISLIGDAPSDILAARANGARSVAVHTGVSTREELLAHGPDHLIENLTAIRLSMLLP